MATTDTCPRCGGSLIAYTLNDAEAGVCEACGWVGVPADHHPEPDPDESWADALRRFRERDRPRGALADAVAIDVGDATYRVPPDVADRWADLTEKQRAVLAELLDEPDPTAPERSQAEIADAAGVHRSYVGTVLREYGDLAAAIVARG